MIESDAKRMMLGVAETYAQLARRAEPRKRGERIELPPGIVQSHE
jgi:hypothetical protein